MALLALLLLGALAAPAGAHAAAGDLDPSFGDRGKVTTHFGNFAYALGVTVDGQGRTIAVGYDYDGQDFALARYKPDGRLDRTFGGDGRVTTDFGGLDFARSVAVDSHGRIVAAGVSEGGVWSFAIARYLPDGRLDTGFGSHGRVKTRFGGTFNEAYSVAIDPLDRIVVGGYTQGYTQEFVEPYTDFALARYRVNGTLDPSFGTGGQVTTDFEHEDGSATGIAIDANGRIAAVGGSQGDFALARYEPDGDLDGTFAGGTVTTNVGSKHDFANGIAIGPQGRIVAAGVAFNGRVDKFALAKYQPSGVLDASFGSGGTVSTLLRPDSTANGVAIDSRGRIAVAGDRLESSGNGFDFGLARYLPDGSLDSSFAGDGTRTTGFGPNTDDQAKAVTIDDQDRVVVAGGSSGEFALVRFLGRGPAR